MTQPAERCSTIARTLAEPLAGTAPLAQAWVALEQPGPWGHRALTDSHLDPALGAELTARTDGTGVTMVLVRRPGHHPDPASGHAPGPVPGSPVRALWIAYTGTDPWLLRAEVRDPSVLADLDFAALAAGVRPDLGEPDPDPLLLVCANSRRDECCALFGRPLAVELAQGRPGRVWETSHLGGHRLAPVVLSLPDGFAFGGPGAGGLSLSSCRGRSTLPRAAQAAELAALAGLAAQAAEGTLAGTADPSPRALAVTAGGARDSQGAGGTDRTVWLVRDPRSTGGSPVRYAVTARTQEPARKESCRKGPVSSLAYEAVRIDP